MPPVEDKVINKILKVKKLAENAGTEGEAQAALCALQNLLSRHNLTIGEVSAKDAPPEQTVDTLVVDKQGMKVHWRGWLGRVVADNFRCESYWSGWGNNWKMVFMGMSTDVYCAKTAYEAAILAIERLKENYVDARAAERREDGGYWSIQDGQYAAKAWKAGFIHGLEDALAYNATKMALVLVKHPKVEEKMLEMHMGKGDRSQSRYGYDAQAREAGKTAGRSYGKGAYGKSIRSGQEQIRA